MIKYKSVKIIETVGNATYARLVIEKPTLFGLFRRRDSAVTIFTTLCGVRAADITSHWFAVDNSMYVNSNIINAMLAGINLEGESNV